MLRPGIRLHARRRCWSSALIGGGVGPWLPYQMLATGWVGLLSGFLPELKRHRRLGAGDAGPSGVLGLIFGAIMNIWFWAVPGRWRVRFDQTEVACGSRG